MSQLTPVDVLAVKYRAKLIQANLRACHSGAEIHEVGNMLNTVSGILDLVDDPGSNTNLMELLDRVEKQQVEFFKRKFPSSVSSSMGNTPVTPETPETPPTPVSQKGIPNTPNTPNTPNEPNR